MSPIWLLRTDLRNIGAETAQHTFNNRHEIVLCTITIIKLLVDIHLLIIRYQDSMLLL